MPYVNESEYKEFLWTKNNAEWQPIASAPNETWVEVIGNCRMVGKPRHFLAIAKRMVKYRPLNPWRDRQLAALDDHGWTPTHWRALQPVPDVGA